MAINNPEFNEKGELVGEKVPFTMVPDALVDADLTCYAKLVYMVLRRHADYSTGVAFPSLGHISRDMGVRSKRQGGDPRRSKGKGKARKEKEPVGVCTIRAALKELAGAGWITSTQRYDPEAKRYLTTLHTVKLIPEGGGMLGEGGVVCPAREGGMLGASSRSSSSRHTAERQHRSSPKRSERAGDEEDYLSPEELAEKSAELVRNLAAKRTPLAAKSRGTEG